LKLEKHVRGEAPWNTLYARGRQSHLARGQKHRNRSGGGP